MDRQEKKRCTPHNPAAEVSRDSFAPRDLAAASTVARLNRRES
ncbi:MAG: hypothetical protein V3U06_08625 [Candidatus Binatia bacterium]